MQKGLKVLGAFMLGFTLLSGPAAASDVIFVEATIQWESVAALDVDLAGTNIVFLRLRAESSEMSVYAHRELINRRLAEVLQASQTSGIPLSHHDVRVVLPGEIANLSVTYPAVFVGDQLIVEADPAHAAINHSTGEGLAKVWARNLGQALDRWAELNFR